MKIENLSVEDIKRGYDAGSGIWTCGVCGKTYRAGEIYPEGGRFFDAPHAVEAHMGSEHPDYLGHLIGNDSKYNSLTANQKQLLRAFAAGRPDKDIAEELGVTGSTVRHQKFMFREKAKQAKFYLAVYERVFESASSPGIEMMPIHDHATMVDERYVVTEQEREGILKKAFSSLSPLHLKAFPPKEKKKVVILTEIAKLFKPGKEYSEKQVNAVLEPVYEDYVMIRRYLIEYGFMARTKDGAKYWLT